MPASSEFLALQQAVAGRYTLVRELGRGGMGVVFLAHEHALERPVAIKMLPLDASADVERRAEFVREARLAAALSHPHVITIHAVEETPTVVYFAMAFVLGESLGDRVRRSGPLATPALLRVVQEVAWALAHAHASGIVHRDIKPDNVLLEADSDRAIVTDFGIAMRDVHHTPGQVAGTRRFMSPEQAAGLPVDGRSDLYSLGILALDAAGVRDATELATRTPAAFAAAIGACVDVDPARRPASATELAARIDAARGAVRLVPAPVRHYLADTRAIASEVGGSAAGAAAAFGLLGANELAAHLGMVGGFTQVFTFVACVSVGAAMTGIAAVRTGALVQRTRQLAQTGYGHAAVRAAATADEQEAPNASLDTPVGWGARSRTAAMIVAATGLSAWAWLAGNDVLQFIGLAGINAFPAIGIRRLIARSGRGRVAFERLMSGRVGRALFKLAGVGRSSAPALPAAGEGTVHVLANAIDGTVRALDPAVQRQLAPVRDALARVRANADAAPARSALLVDALEAMRLDLLRLEAGAAQGEGITDAVRAAERLAREVDAQVAAESEVRRLLGAATDG